MQDPPMVTFMAFLIFMSLGYGFFAIAWTIASAISSRIARPTKEGFRYAGLWLIIAWVVVSIPALIIMSKGVHLLGLLILIVIAILASIGGACYGNDKPSSN